MKHENGGATCERCESMLVQAHNDITYWFHRIREAFPTAHVCRVWCGKDEQDRLVAEKASLLKWPNSKHNHTENMVPCSLAMDLFSLLENGEADFRPGFYVQIANFLEDAGAPIEWGGNFKHFSDSDHFQLKS